MNLQELHDEGKNSSLIQVFKGEGAVTAMRLAANEVLKKHTSKVPALLVCVTGEVIYQEENGTKETLRSGDYVHIVPDVVHWIDSISESNLLLIK